MPSAKDSKQAHLAHCTKKLLDLTRRILEESYKIEISDALLYERYFKVTALYFLARARQNLEAVVALVAAGYPTQAMMVARSSFELAINLQYIMKDVPKHIDLYMNYEFVEKWRLIEGLEKWEYLHPEAMRLKDDKMREMIRLENEKVRDDYPNKLQWSGKSMKDMCKDLGGQYEYAYDVTYAILCKHTHSSIMISRSNVKRLGDSHTVYASANSADAQPAVQASLMFLRSIAEDFNGIFKLGFKVEIEDFDKLLKGGQSS